MLKKIVRSPGWSVTELASLKFWEIELSAQNSILVNRNTYFWTKMEDLDHKTFFLHWKINKEPKFQRISKSELSWLRSREIFAPRETLHVFL